MKKLFILVCLMEVCANLLAQQITPIKKLAPLKLKGTLPFLVKGSSAIRYIVPASATNPTFKIQRGTTNSSRTAGSSTTTPPTKENGRYCTTTEISEEKGDFTRIVLGNQNDKIYPGAIYYDDAIINGTYNAPTNLELKSYDITTDLFSAASSGTSIVNVPASLGGVNDGIGELMRRSGRVKNAASVSIDVKLMSSKEQLAFEIGAGFTGYGAELSANLDYLKSTSKNVFIAKLTQVYFSVMLNRADGRLLAANNASYPNLVYVNKVNYGRLGYILIASDSSRESIDAALHFTYDGGSARGSINAGMNFQKVFSSMEVKGFFYGGDAANVMTISSPTQLQTFDDYVQNGLRLDPNVAPIAVSYELKYLNDNATAATRSTTKYTENNCTPAKGIKIQLHNVAIEDIHGGDCSYAYGNISVEVWETDNNKRPAKSLYVQTLWSHTATNPNRTVINYADIRADRTIRPEIKNLPSGTRIINLNPIAVNEGRIMLKFKCEINTNHKDNDIAALGEHGMKRVEVVSKMLNEVFASSEQIAANENRYKYGTFTAGRWCSNTNRLHCFYALFTVTNP